MFSCVLEVEKADWLFQWGKNETHELELLSSHEDVDVVKSVNYQCEEDWNVFYFDFNFKNKDVIYEAFLGLKDEVLRLKKKFKLPDSCTLEPYFSLTYFPKVWSMYELDIYLNIHFSIKMDDYFNSLTDKQKYKLSQKEDALNEYFREKIQHNCSIIVLTTNACEKLKKLANLFYFQQNNMTIYEKLLEEPILDSEVNHEGNVMRSTAKLKRLHRQTLDYFRNPDSIFQNNFWS